MLRKLFILLSVIFFTKICFAKQQDINIASGATNNETLFTRKDKKNRVLLIAPCIINEQVHNKNILSVFLNTFQENADEHVNYSYKDINTKYKKAITTIFKKVEDNLQILDILDVSSKYDMCNDLNDYITNTNQDPQDFIFDFKNLKKSYKFIVTGKLNPDSGSSDFKLELFIWDTLERDVIAGQYYLVNKNNLKSIANIISDFIYGVSTHSRSGLFDTKIVYIQEEKTKKSLTRQIRVMDFNGENNVKVLETNNLIINPTFSRTKNGEIYYVEYETSSPRLYKKDLVTNKEYLIKIDGIDGLTFAPNFNPTNPNEMILALVEDKGTNLFLLDLSAQKYVRLTNDNFINISPNFSPSGNKIVYVSDKTGAAQLYVFNLVKKQLKKISGSAGVYNKPVWSPDGKNIAFINMYKDTFRLGLIDELGNNERYITKAYNIDNIKWMPNSRHILYSKQDKVFGILELQNLYVIDTLTGKEYKLNTGNKTLSVLDPDVIKYR